MEYRNVKDLKKLPNNPRTIKDEHFKKLVKSIKENPDYFEARPIILSDRTGELIIIAGNQRYDAAKSLKLDKVPTFLMEGLTEEKEREIIIRDNISNGEWDYTILKSEWNSLELEDWGLELFNKENLDEFFDTPGKYTEEKVNTQIILNYVKEDYDQVIQWFNTIGKSKEEVVYNLLEKESKSE